MTKNIKKCRLKYQSFISFIRNDLAERLVKTLRADETDAFRRSSWFSVIDAFNTKKQTVLEVVKEIFEREDMQTQYIVLGYRIYLYFHKHELSIEVDEFGHSKRNSYNEKKREEELTKELGFMLTGINPDEENVSINKAINEKWKHIKESNQKLIK